jgi:NDP-sugar pyrophosphorylase family protein
MDYSIHDALRAGFTRVVFVVRAAFLGAFEATVGARYRDKLLVETVSQEIDDLPAGFAVPTGRTRPWGTVQAVLSARDHLTGPFAVLNADDLYGREAIAQVGEFLRQAEAGSTDHAVVGYRMDLTGSPWGSVNRALLALAPDGTLREVLELQDLVPTGESYEGRLKGEPKRVARDSLVSMNLWAFTPTILPVLEGAFRRFLERHPGDEAELRVADAVQEGIVRREATVRVLPTTSRWCGVTHPQDRDWVRGTLAELVRRGEYPERLV